MPPFLIVALGSLGTAALVKLLARESRRVNAELDENRRDGARDDAHESPSPASARRSAGGTDGAPASAARPTLRRDPSTGEYRPQ